MTNRPEEDSKDEKEVKLRPEAVKALLDHIHQLEKLAAQTLIDAELLAANVRCLLEELRLIKLITDQKGW